MAKVQKHMTTLHHPEGFPHSHGKTETQPSQMRNETEKGEGQKGKRGLLDVG